MREQDLLRLIAARSADLPARFADVLVGPGDDCAVVRAGSGSLLLKVDQVVESRHFDPGTPMDRVAHKALGRALSDIAACGGTPVCGLAAATLPAGFAEADGLFEALAERAAAWGCPLVGGDIASWERGGRLVLSITIVGRPHPGRGPVLRAGAAPGDHVYVTGALGGAWQPGGRHLFFEPRLAEARWLCDHLGDGLTAMIDVSDGLGIDAGRLAAASGVRVDLDADRLPRHPDAPATPGCDRELGDGEDYELLFTTPADLPGACPATGTRLTRVGRVASAGSPGAWVVRAGHEPRDVSSLGFDHGSPHPGPARP